MDAVIREYQPPDEPRVVELSLRAWVAAVDRQVVGFVAATIERERRLGEILMLAVDPDSEGQEVGGALTEFATEWLRSAGARIAMVGTGGDPGHAPARRVYERAGYTALPVARYFKAL